MLYISVFVGSVLFFYVFEQYLRMRKVRALGQGFPARLKGLGLEDDYQTTVDYNLTKNNFAYVTDGFGAVQGLVMIYFAPLLWDWGTTHAAGSDYACVMIFLLVNQTIETVLGLPFDVYSTFVIEEKFGFNKYTAKSYAMDKVKSFLVGLLISGILFMGLVAVMDWAGNNAWFYLWCFISAFIFVFNMLYPILIAPLFNTFKPLASENIKKGIDELVEKTGLNCKKVFEVDGSKQSSHSNAYVTGFFGSKRIVIYDTLIKDLEEDVGLINAVVGHEIGHAVMQHNWALLGMSLLNVFVMFWSFGFFQNTDEVVHSFGYKTANTFLRLQCFMAVYSSVIMPFFSVFMNGVTRVLEFQADAYSVSLGFDISTALVKISKTNKGDLNPDWLHSLVHHNHPPLLERIEAVSSLDKKKE